MTQLLITGASGLLGSNLVREAETSFDVTAVVHNHPLRFERAKVVQADLTETQALHKLFQEVHPEWIIHCAADIAIEELERDPQRAARINTHMAGELARIAASLGARMLFVSTDSVFDGRTGSYAEDDEPIPLNVYARSKLEGEYAVTEEHSGALIIRTNIFGWSPGGKPSLAEWFYSELTRGQRCSGFSDIYFSPVYAPDLMPIFTQMLERDLKGIFHVPGDECITKYDFACRLAKAFNFEQGLIRSSTSDQMHWTAERPKKTCLDGSKIIQTLGIELPVLANGLLRFRTDLNRRFADRAQ